MNQLDFWKDRIRDYHQLAWRLGGCILCNAMGERELELINGELDPEREIFQYYIIEDPWLLTNLTHELVFWDEELGLYVWGVTHFGTAWHLVDFDNWVEEFVDDDDGLTD